MAANKVTAVRAESFGNPSRCQGKLRAVGAGGADGSFFLWSQIDSALSGCCDRSGGDLAGVSL